MIKQSLMIFGSDRIPRNIYLLLKLVYSQSSYLFLAKIWPSLSVLTWLRPSWLSPDLDLTLTWAWQNDVDVALRNVKTNLRKDDTLKMMIEVKMLIILIFNFFLF